MNDRKNTLAILDYPENSPLWMDSEKKILFINQQGFRQGEHLRARGLLQHPFADTFGIADRDEALRRQALIRYMAENDEVRQIIFDLNNRTRLHCPSPDDRKGWIENGQKFVEYFNPEKRNSFWSDVDRLIRALSIGKLPPALHGFLGFLHEAKNVREETEHDMGKDISTELLRSTKLRGSVVVSVDNCYSVAVTRSECIGHRLYQLSPPLSVVYKDTWKTGFYKITGLGKLLAKIAEWRHAKEVTHWSRPNIIDRCPEEIKEAVSGYVSDLLVSIKKTLKIPAGSIDLYIRFVYDENGLQINLVGLDERNMVPPDDWEPEIEKDMDNFQYFSQKDLDLLQSQKDQQRRRSYIVHVLTHFMPRFNVMLRRVAREFVSPRGVIIQNSSVDCLFKWSHVKTMCELPEYRDVFKEAIRIRQFVCDKIQELCLIAKIADEYVIRAKKWNMPLSFPQLIESSEPIFRFDELWPVSLIGRDALIEGKTKNIEATDLRPIKSLAEIRGGISIMTGDNAAGKTTIGEEIIGLLYDAASGLPVFGRNVVLNLRNVIGTVYLERGLGSTMQLSLVKAAKVLDEVAKHPHNGTFVFWDELGTGTTPTEGLVLGQACLKKLVQTRTTVLTNTQLPGLAEWAQREIGAKCFQVSADHVVREGIGTADVSRLAREMNVDKILGLSDN